MSPPPFMSPPPSSRFRIARRISSAAAENPFSRVNSSPLGSTKVPFMQLPKYAGGTGGFNRLRQSTAKAKWTGSPSLTSRALTAQTHTYAAATPGFQEGGGAAAVGHHVVEGDPDTYAGEGIDGHLYRQKRRLLLLIRLEEHQGWGKWV
ncbi:hypothetical protein H6P81_011132 [Aristolochia fimbriata]|uniref:Uncharacterized protein n=1 Tax=Aristolochia fimbriata TaxID=158543 RepID=A0AAV7EU50_ARIFI|nr:hypothetical protein H6P81_011132 [Aristolochia fimbriata]